MWNSVIVILGIGLSARGLSAKLEIGQVKERYKNLTQLSATINQTKISSVLSKPLKSKIRLSYDGKEIRWQTLQPVPSLVVINDRGLKIVQDGKTEEIPAAANRQLAELLTFIKSIVTADFSQLEQKYQLSADSLTITAQARDAAASAYFRTFKMTFDRSLSIIRLDLFAADEQSSLEFSDLDIRINGI